MDVFLKLLALAGAVLVLFDCSRPKRATVRRWIHYLAIRLKRIRQPNDHRRAAATIWLLERRIGRSLLKGWLGAVMRPLSGNSWIIATFLIGILLLPASTPPDNTVGWIGTAYLLLMAPVLAGTIMIMASGKWVQEADQRVHRFFPRWWGWPFIKYAQVFGVGLRATATPHGYDVAFHRGKLAIISLLGIIAYVAKGLAYIEWSTNWPEPVFFTFFLLAGQITIFFFLALVAFALSLLGGKVEQNVPRLLANTLYWSTSLMILIVMARIARTTGGYFGQIGAGGILVFFVSDTLTIFLFRALVADIIRTRRESTRTQFRLLAQYGAFFLRTCLAGLIATYMVVAITQGSVWSLVEAWRVFIGRTPDGTDWLDWPSAIMAHSMFIPLAILLSVPVAMIVHRLVLFTVYVLGANIVKNSNPLAYVSALLGLTGVALDLAFGFTAQWFGGSPAA